MNEIQQNIIRFANIRKKSINHCLLVLGATKEEVYLDHNKRVFKTPHRSTNYSIYDKYSREDLKDWLRYLYVEALKKYHPDKHPENAVLYTEICQELGKAYQQGEKILNGGR
jgi:hypothetical protein